MNCQKKNILTMEIALVLFFSICAFTVLGVSFGFAQEKTKTDSSQLLQDVAPADYEALFGARMQRTMSLLATSNARRKNPVKILFYGQSVTAQAWTNILTNELRKRFSNTDIIAENRAIGGFTAPLLVRTALHDVYSFYPDLVVFHVWGGLSTGEFERIVSNIRRNTTAEIAIWTHHISQPGEVGSEEFMSRLRADDYESNAIRYLTQKYDCELIDVRLEWDKYLKEHNLEPKALLRDMVHLNARGCQLMATLIARHFRFNPLFPCGWTNTVRTYEAKRLPDEGTGDEITFTGKPWGIVEASAVGVSPESALQLTFKGNRVDVIAGSVKSERPGTARVFIDGKPPSENPMLYTITLPSKAFRCWMPAIKRVSHVSKLICEDWTLRILEISGDAAQFTYEVIGSKTGYDGVGSNNETFISNSGRVVIEPRDFMITWVQNYFKTKCPVGFEVTWSVQPMFLDTYVPPVMNDSSGVNIVTLAKGLENGIHTLKIVPNGDGVIPIEEIQVHCPPLQ